MNYYSKDKNDNALELLVIKTKDKVYIADNKNLDRYSSNCISGYLFDGNSPKKTHKEKWYELESIPKKVTERLPNKSINIRFELKENHYSTGLPKVLPPSSFNDGEEYESVYGLYERKFDTEEGGFRNIKFSVVVLDEIENFQITKSEYNVNHAVIDQIQYHPILLSTRPCYTTSEESYRIIRSYIKQNIDPKYATITSDYDFCFTVKKIIEHDPVSYIVNVGKRKPKYETRYNRSRTVEVFQMAPKPYQGYTVIGKFTGKDEEDLNNNIDTYLKELMEQINKPYVECKHCEGMGVVLNEIQNKLS